MVDIKPTTLRSMGRRARLRAQDRAGSGRIPEAAWYPEIMLLRDKALTWQQVADAVGLSPGRCRAIAQWGKNEESMLRELPVAKLRSALTPEHLAMLEPTAEAFREFYRAFGPHDDIPEHCMEWIRDFLSSYNVMLNVPPRHNKSHMFSVWVPIWLICMDRNEEIILLSANRDLAQGFAYEIASELTTNGPLIEAFGRFAPEQKGDLPWRPLQGELIVMGRTRAAKSGQFTIQARGSQQHILGKEATVIIVDDLTNAERARSDTERVKELKWFQEQAMTRVMPVNYTKMSGHVMVVGQRVDYRDFYGELLRQKFLRDPPPEIGKKKGDPLWQVITYPAVLEWPDEGLGIEPRVLWPEMHDFVDLMLVYERVGGHNVFECMYQQNPLPEDAQLVNEAWLEGCRDYGRSRGHGPRDDVGPRGEQFLPVVRVVSIDPGLREFSAICVADVLCKRDTFATSVVELSHWKPGSQKLAEHVVEAVRRHRPDYIIFEHSTASYHVFDSPDFVRLRQQFGPRLIGHNTGSNKHDPEWGVTSLAGDFEMGRIRLPYAAEEDRKMSRLLEDEALVYPFGDTNDVLMALWFVKAQLKRLRPVNYEVTTILGGAKNAAKNPTWGFVRDAMRSKDAQETQNMRRYRAAKAKAKERANANRT
jgi:hypothetical protein